MAEHPRRPPDERQQRQRESARANAWYARIKAENGERYKRYLARARACAAAHSRRAARLRRAQIPERLKRKLKRLAEQRAAVRAYARSRGWRP